MAVIRCYPKIDVTLLTIQNSLFFIHPLLELFYPTHRTYIWADNSTMCREALLLTVPLQAACCILAWT